MPNLDQNRRFFVSSVLEIWQNTLKINRVDLLCHIKPRASFHSLIWIRTGVTVCKHLNWLNSKRPGGVDSSNVYMRWLSAVTSGKCHCCTWQRHKLRDIWDMMNPWSAMSNQKHSLATGHGITPDNFMMIQWEEHWQKGVTDRWTGRQTGGRTEVFLELLGHS